jgi:ABC-type bacteriocin/lantibiotic exporter with double-glycine peptidase domain
MIILSQKNPLWRNVKIGKSNSAIADYGCVITSLSMLSEWYGKYKDPEWMAKNLSFTLEGLILWKSITESILPMKFVYRYYAKNDIKIKEILASKNSACILQVNGNHWVVLIGYSKMFGYKVADPFYGDTTYLISRNYKITGFTELIRK